jgi:probable HAF family extracellular repeat protein
MRDLGTLDGDFASSSGADAVNNLGEIVGASYSHSLGTSRAVFFQRDGPTDLGSLALYSYADSVNDLGEVVGQSGTISGDLHAFRSNLYNPQAVDLNSEIPPDSGWLLVYATGVNNAGEIVGTGNFKGQIHGYLLTPMDGPGTALASIELALENGRASPPRVVGTATALLTVGLLQAAETVDITDSSTPRRDVVAPLVTSADKRGDVPANAGQANPFADPLGT